MIRCYLCNGVLEEVFEELELRHEPGRETAKKVEEQLNLIRMMSESNNPFILTSFTSSCIVQHHRILPRIL